MNAEVLLDLKEEMRNCFDETGRLPNKLELEAWLAEQYSTSENEIESAIKVLEKEFELQIAKANNEMEMIKLSEYYLKFDVVVKSQNTFDMFNIYNCEEYGPCGTETFDIIVKDGHYYNRNFDDIEKMNLELYGK